MKRPVINWTYCIWRSKCIGRIGSFKISTTVGKSRKKFPHCSATESYPYPKPYSMKNKIKIDTLMKKKNYFFYPLI